MATFIWKRVKSGTPSARVFSAYLALVLAVAVVGPGLAVYAAEGDVPEAPSELVVPAEEAVEAEPVAEDSVEVPAVEPASVPEQVEEDPVSEPAVEPSKEIVQTASAVTPLNAGARPVCEGGVKLDNDPRTGTYTIDSSKSVVTPTTPDDFEITITTYTTDDGMMFNFTSNYPVSHIGVKGGNTGYNDYNYDPAVYSDTGLHAPVNPSGKYADISHIIFCFGEVEEPESHVIVRKFRDLDADGERDGGEDWLEGFTFRLERGESETGPWTLVDEITTSGANGQADFGMQPMGWYRITEMLTGDQIAAGETPTTGDPLGIMVFYHTAQQNSEKWFGNVVIPDDPEEGDLIVYKFHDLDEDGEYDDGEPMLEGWEFTLSIDGSDIDSGLTDENGELLFEGLEPGEYTVTETLEDGWTNTTPLSQDVTVVDGQTASVWFGNIPVPDDPEEGDLIVYKFHDLDEDGEYDDGEPMLEGWEFTLSIDGSDIDSGLTDENGELLFEGLEPGEYTVTETLEDGWTNTTPLSQDVTVVDGQTASVWFGNIEEFLPYTELDLAILKSVDKPTADPGELLTYTLTYWNNGDLVATDFTITDDFDERYLTIVDAAGGTVADGKIVWELPGPLAKEDGKKTITYTARVKSEMPDGTTNIDNVVVIEHPRDEDPSNNTDDARVVVRVGEPFLPFTGGEYLLLIGLAAAAATAGTLLRYRSGAAV